MSTNPENVPAVTEEAPGESGALAAELETMRAAYDKVLLQVRQYKNLLEGARPDPEGLDLPTTPEDAEESFEDVYRGRMRHANRVLDLLDEVRKYKCDAAVGQHTIDELRATIELHERSLREYERACKDYADLLVEHKKLRARYDVARRDRRELRQLVVFEQSIRGWFARECAQKATELRAARAVNEHLVLVVKDLEKALRRERTRGFLSRLFR